MVGSTLIFGPNRFDCFHIYWEEIEKIDEKNNVPII